MTPPSPASQVLCVGASPRKGGNSDLILDTLENQFTAAGIACETVRLRDHHISPCIGCEGCRNDHICRGCRDDMQALYPKITAARGLVLVSPTHHYNITAWMKAFIDRLYCFYSFGTDCPRSWSSCLAGQGRVAALAGVCEQEDRADMGFTLEAMNLPLTALGYEILAEAAIFKVFERAGMASRPGEMQKISDLGNAMTEALK